MRCVLLLMHTDSALHVEPEMSWRVWAERCMRMSRCVAAPSAPDTRLPCEQLQQHAVNRMRPAYVFESLCAGRCGLGWLAAQALQPFWQPLMLCPMLVWLAGILALQRSSAQRARSRFCRARRRARCTVSATSNEQRSARKVSILPQCAGGLAVPKRRRAHGGSHRRAAGP